MTDGWYGGRVPGRGVAAAAARVGAAARVVVGPGAAAAAPLLAGVQGLALQGATPPQG